MVHNYQRSFSFEEAPPSSTEQAPLTHCHAHNHSNSSNQSNHEPYHDSPSRASPVSPSSQFFSPLPNDIHTSPPSPPTQRYHPSSHPDSNFGQARRARNTSSDSSSHRLSSSSQSTPYHNHSHSHPQPSPPPPPPPHRRKPVGQSPAGRFSIHDQGYAQASRSLSSFNTSVDNLGQGQPDRSMDRVDGHMAHIRQGDGETQPFPALEASSTRRSDGPADFNHPSIPSDPAYLAQRPAEAPRHLRQQGSYSSSTIPIAAGAATPGSITPIIPPSDGSGQSFPLADYQSRHIPTAQYPYQHSPYQNSSLNFAPQVSDADINPQNIADDGDDGFMPDPKRKSMLGMRSTSSNEAGTSAAAGGAAAGGIMGALGGLAGRKQKAQTPGVGYDPVVQPGDLGNMDAEGHRGAEKSEWLSRQTTGNNKMRWVVGLAIGLVIVLAIVGGIVGGVLGSRSTAKSSGETESPSGNSINNANDDTASNGDLSKGSAEIKKLMNNRDLHRVFPAIDYTPWGTQYPLCVEFPPSQNNVTRDMAVLSQLTNTVRLYGTDCNQTEMVLHAIDRLGLSSMKVWLGVWIETNTTTNERQLEQMYKILKDVSDHSIFKGVIVGNEALYRAGVDKAASKENLIEILTQVKSNFTSLNYDLLVATSDLGDNWDSSLVQASDAVMSNIHPFFAGVPVEEAAGWTWSFWQMKDAPLTAGTDKKQIISETGWPSGGGNDCGTLTTECANPTSGSVAGIDEMNTFMADFVCQAMDNGTDYFWFEAFDEPWKIVYNTPGQEWEDKWGLMYSDRQLKPGLKIPDCGGRTV
ncbi:hypothetical protein GJ744_000132 [Endocarpon pusillum]|uniref:glucan endo-1,3-beta-D-glucosidase n=1 Tax=Endocarpon pusillum TaxID=364733 RepID=A0A8H7E9M9_9EURO|nr:hypothetical protein GJ744_000132 [Endocarpon pusillum]